MHSMRAFSTIVLEHIKQFPEMQVQDLYKLVFQAAMGSEHAVADPLQVHENLVAEIDGSIPQTGIPMTLPLSSAHPLIRINLHPFRSAGGSLTDLAHAFVRTALIFQPSQDRLAQYWSCVVSMATSGKLPFIRRQLEHYGDQRRTEGYPVVHHSPQFRNIYRPAYRVVLKDLLEIPGK